MAVLLDLDGTLVDSVHHHVMTWDLALTELGHEVPLHRIHAGIGMGADRLLPWLLGDHRHDEDALTRRHRELFLERTDRLRPTRGARALVEDLELRDVPFVVATSAGTDERDALLSVLGREDLPVVDADDVASSKPAPDLVRAACRQLDVDPADAVMVGDTPWDGHAARAAGARAVLVRCGGFGDDALREAAPDRIATDPGELVGQL